jgi:hypothetical protein
MSGNTDTYTFLQGMLWLKPTSSPLNRNSVPLDRRQLTFGAGRHSTKKKTDIGQAKSTQKNMYAHRKNVSIDCEFGYLHTDTDSEL